MQALHLRNKTIFFRRERSAPFEEIHDGKQILQIIPIPQIVFSPFSRKLWMISDTYLIAKWFHPKFTSGIEAGSRMKNFATWILQLRNSSAGFALFLVINDRITRVHSFFDSNSNQMVTWEHQFHLRHWKTKYFLAKNDSPSAIDSHFRKPEQMWTRWSVKAAESEVVNSYISL